MQLKAINGRYAVNGQRLWILHGDVVDMTNTRTLPKPGDVIVLEKFLGDHDLRVIVRSLKNHHSLFEIKGEVL